jgi:hypothetical protein
MTPINKLRADQIQRILRKVKNYTTIKNKKITTVDPIIRIGKTLFPTLTHRELMELSQIVLRIILSETTTLSYQTTLFVHI